MPVSSDPLGDFINNGFTSPGTGLGDIGKLLTIGGALQGSQSSNTTEELRRMLMNVIGQGQSTLLDTSKEYTKDKAVTDANGVVANIFRNYRNKDLPEIFQAQSNSGGYNSTTGQLLANDAFGAATSKAAEATLANIVNYRGLQQKDFSALAQLFDSKAGSPPSGGTGGKEASNEMDILGTLIGVGTKAFLGF